MICSSCAANLHEFCCFPVSLDDKGLYAFCCCYEEETSTVEVDTPPTSSKNGNTIGDKLREALGPFEREPKSSDTLRDVLSTGRKRAAYAKPFSTGIVCEWAGLKFAGGGVKPIVGCTGTVLVQERGKYARHHGPDKNVINNGPSNLHLICVTCHNRWHTLNDPFYGDGTGDSRPPAGTSWLPEGKWKEHDPLTMASTAEIFNNEVQWKYTPSEREK